MQTTGLNIIATKCARDHGIPLPLVLGVIEVESAGNEWATRFERYYRWCVNVRTGRPFTATAAQADSAHAPAGFPAPDPADFGYYSSADTEWIGQKTSWGNMQVLGAVAREHGWTQPLPLLCDPQYGIEYGCRHLARLYDRFGQRHGWAGTLDAYNDGTARIERPVDYPHKVAATSDEAQHIIGLSL